MPYVDVWAVQTDPGIPADVVRRLAGRQAARQQGRVPDVVPEADKSWLARHVVTKCGAHDELISGDPDWTHLSDHQPCPPPVPDPLEFL